MRWLLLVCLGVVSAVDLHIKKQGVPSGQEFLALSAEQKELVMAELFNGLDADRDGSISRHEVRHSIIHNIRFEAEQLSHTHFHKIASRIAGNISREDINRHYENDFSSADLSDTEERELLELKFTLADVNQDGVLTEDEYVAYYEPALFPHMKNFTVREILVDYDEDKDGKLCMDDFIDFMEPENEAEEQFFEAYFDQFDVDKNELLDGDEIYEAATNEITIHEIMMLFDELDSDEDEKLSLKEVMNHPKIFLDFTMPPPDEMEHSEL